MSVRCLIFKPASLHNTITCTIVLQRIVSHRRLTNIICCISEESDCAVRVRTTSNTKWPSLDAIRRGCDSAVDEFIVLQVVKLYIFSNVRYATCAPSHSSSGDDQEGTKWTSLSESLAGVMAPATVASSCTTPWSCSWLDLDVGRPPPCSAHCIHPSCRCPPSAHDRPLPDRFCGWWVSQVQNLTAMCPVATHSTWHSVTHATSLNSGGKIGTRQVDSSPSRGNTAAPASLHTLVSRWVICCRYLWGSCYF